MRRVISMTSGRDSGHHNISTSPPLPSRISPLTHLQNERTNRRRSRAEPAELRDYPRHPGSYPTRKARRRTCRDRGFVRCVLYRSDKIDTNSDAIGMIGGCGQMFEAIIISPQFTKKTTLARHRLVNSTLKEEIAAIHAWTPKCFTPEEWEKKKGGG